MSSDQELNKGITLENICEELSSEYTAIEEELNLKLKAEPKLRRLKRIGEEQFYNATSESSIEMEQQNTRLCFAKVSLLVHEVHDRIDEIVSEKFHDDNFHKQTKERVLQTIMKLYSEKKCKQLAAEGSEASSSSSSSSSGRSDVNSKENQKIMLEKVKEDSKLYADNLIDITKKVIDMPLDETEASTTEDLKENCSSKSKTAEQVENDDLDNENISIGSLSSVHTSDLSSFEDEMVLSSDEETGRKSERLSLKEAQERLAKMNIKEARKQKKEKTTKDKDESLPGTSASDTSNVPPKTQRVRKPNSKYSSDVILTPLRRSSTEKSSTSKAGSSVDNSLPRKRGRPRKKH